MHGDSHDRYERLTSVSSSVDFDQRDNVSALPRLLSHPLILQGMWAEHPLASREQSRGPVECGLLSRAVLPSEPQESHPDPEPLALSPVSASRAA